jgi:transcriptional regulator with XRE-family HTH domain
MRIPIDKLPPLPGTTDALPLLPSGVPDTTTSAATALNAQFLWRMAHAMASQESIPRTRESVPGRIVTANMSKVLRDAFLGMASNDESDNARRELYDWLRDTRNMVCTEKRQYGGSDWWVADAWNPYRHGTPSPSEGALASYKERRLRPEDTGEHRDPHPVTATWRCTQPGCPDTQVYPHAGALDEHYRQAHAPGEEVQQRELYLSLGEAEQLEAVPEADPQPGEEDGEFSYDQLSRRIWEAVQATGKSQRQVASDCGLAPSSLSSMITGRQRVSVAQLAVIARATGVSVASLLGEPSVVVMAPPVADPPVVVLPPSAPLIISEIPTGELVSVLASRMEATESEVRYLRAAAGSDSEKDSEIAELREEIAMHRATIESMRGDIHRYHTMMGR